MKKGKLLALIAAGALSVLMLVSCMDEDFADEPENEVTESVEDVAETDSDSDEEQTETKTEAEKVAYVADGVAADESDVTNVAGDLVFESTSEMDENPTRAVRRSTTPINQTVGTMLDGTPLPENFYMYRNALPDQYKKAYDQICKGLKEKSPTIVMSVAVPAQDMNNVYYSVSYDHPEFFWVSHKYRFYQNNSGIVTQVEPEYFEGSPEAFTADVESNLNEALADMWALGRDVEKVKYAHDYLTNTIVYVKNDLDQSAYSAIVWKQTVCAGYSKAFAYMMHKMGIPCAVITGNAGGPHAWNILYLDGDYYVMDVTWDDPSSGDPNSYKYNYFNITDAQIGKDHARGGNGLDISCYLPGANGTAMNFQNYFGGSAYGTNFAAINGVMPEKVTNGGSGYNDYDDYDDYDTQDDNYDDYDYDPGYYEYDDYGDNSGWWNVLDSSWTQDDWEYYDEGGYWYIYDEGTGYIYLYFEDENAYGAMTEEDQENIYWLNPQTGEWELDGGYDY